MIFGLAFNAPDKLEGAIPDPPDEPTTPSPGPPGRGPSGRWWSLHWASDN